MESILPISCIIKNSENSLSIKILDPENVILGPNDTENTLGYIINSGDTKLDFSPSDFSSSKLLDSTENMFSTCGNLIKMCKLPSSITNAYFMFAGCKSLESIDTTCFTHVTNAIGMFQMCNSLKLIDAIGFAHVTDASRMFWGCTKLEYINNCSFKKSIEINNMLNYCTSLKEIKFSSGTEYLEQYEKLIISNSGDLSEAQIENAKMYSSSPIIRFKRD